VGKGRRELAITSSNDNTRGAMNRKHRQSFPLEDEIEQTIMRIGERHKIRPFERTSQLVQRAAAIGDDDAKQLLETGLFDHRKQCE
jgi:hypothetical protein